MICSKCKIDKPHIDFYVRTDRASGFVSACKSCCKFRASCQDKAVRNLNAKNKRESQVYERILKSCKDSSKWRGIPFELVLEDIPQNTHCPYFGVEFTNIIGKGQQDFNRSIDRIDNTKGYTKDNIEVISCLANKMKATATKEQLQAFSVGVLKRFPC